MSSDGLFVCIKVSKSALCCYVNTKLFQIKFKLPSIKQLLTASGNKKASTCSESNQTGLFYLRFTVTYVNMNNLKLLSIHLGVYAVM